MNILYAKTVLYVYPNIMNIVKQIDEVVEKKALSSMDDYSPCLAQCEKISEYTRQKINFLILKRVCDRIMSKLSDEEKTLLEYKFFKRKKREEFDGFDFSSRTYFRKQIRLAEKFARLLIKGGIKEENFAEDYLASEFMRDLYKRVGEQEKLIRKNKSAAEKAAAAVLAKHKIAIGEQTDPTEKFFCERNVLWRDKRSQ